jgi:gentisate 1,2-dioxygenase
MGDDGLQPLWNLAEDLLPETPRPRAVAHRWDGTRLRELVALAGELVPIGEIGDRRALALANPGLGGRPWATPTLWAALQQLNPGEAAPAHRHSAAAIRFVVDGTSVWTTVDGDECTMHRGDLVLTPPWTWHEHVSASDAPMVWFDGLDLPLVHALDAMFHEPHPTGRQPVAGRDLSERHSFGGRSLPDDPGTGAASRLLVYRWAQTDAALEHLIRSGRRVARLEFTNPASGGPALPTLGCAAWRLAPSSGTGEQRRCASSVFLVLDGTGSSLVDDTELSWTAGDIFAVPSWARVTHRSTTACDLFELTDEPVLRALGLYREQVAPQL